MQVLKSEVISEIYRTFEKIGAPVHVLCVIGSIGDTLSDDEVIGELKAFNNGEEFKVLAESDEHVLFEAEQASKRAQKTNEAQPATPTNSAMDEIALLESLLNCSDNDLCELCRIDITQRIARLRQ